MARSFARLPLALRPLVTKALPLLAGSAMVSSMASCVGAAEARPIALNDPLGILDEADSVRLFLLPGDTYACLSATGTVAPTVPDVAVGETGVAVVDILLSVSGGQASQEVSVPPGDYIAYVRAKGTDATSGVRDTVIGSGCAEVYGVESNVSRSVVITLDPVFTPGDCSDSVLSPDEQCTTPGVGDCDASCHTTPYAVNVNVDEGAETLPRVGAARADQRALVAFVSENTSIGMRVVGSDGQPLTTPTALVGDDVLNNVLASAAPPRSGVTSPEFAASPAVASTGRMALAVGFGLTSNFDVRVGFFSTSRAPEADFAAVRADESGHQRNPSGAFSSTGAYSVVFEDAEGGLWWRGFAAGSTTPSGADAVQVSTTGTNPALAGRSDGFALAYLDGGAVMVRTIDASGTASAAVRAFDDSSATQSEPRVAGLSDGSFVVVFADSAIDASGTGIRAVLFGSDGVAGRSFQVNGTSEGAQSAPDVAAFDDRLAFVWAQADGVYARFFTVAGEPALNRESSPSTSEFLLASGASLPSVAASGTGAGQNWIFAYRTLSDGLGQIVGRRLPR